VANLTSEPGYTTGLDTCGFNLKEKKKNTELRELFGQEPVSLAIKRGRLQ